jgi:MYXO-CTERM domain-containing protein
MSQRPGIAARTPVGRAAVRHFVPALTAQCAAWLACATLATALLPQPCAACPPCLCTATFPRVEPRVEYVPRNARVLVSGAEADRFVLRARNAATIALDTEPSAMPGSVWVSARTLLSTDIEYTIEPEVPTDDAGVAPGSQMPLPILHALGYEDHAPPLALDVSVVPAGSTYSCQPSIAASVNVELLTDAEDKRGLALFYAQVNIAIDGVQQSTILRISSGARVRSVFGRDEGCYFGSALALARTGVTATAQVTIIDQAGNATEAVPLNFEFEVATGLQCTMFAGNSGSAGAPGGSPIAGAPGNEAGHLATADTQPTIRARETKHVKSCGFAPSQTSGSGAIWVTALLLAARVVRQRRRRDRNHL